MLKELLEESNLTRTENGAVTYNSSMSDCLDFFGTAGALRKARKHEIIRRFLRAYTEDRNLALKALFFARDIRGGLGERRVFRILLHYLAEQEPAVVRKNLSLIAEYGRYDDLLVLMDTPCEEDALRLIRAQLSLDQEALEQGAPVSLLAKWLPSVNTSSAEQSALGKRIAKACGMQEREYRKTLSALRRALAIIENPLREKDYSFDYEKQCSRALYKYRRAFMRHDGERYSAFLRAASAGEAKLNASNLYPYELVDPYLDQSYCTNRTRCFMRPVSEEEKAVLNASWAALPDYVGGGKAADSEGTDGAVDGAAEASGMRKYAWKNALAIVDTSGSMYWDHSPKPASVALSLGLYFAERNQGEFRNHFILFSRSPKLICLKGETFADRLRYAASFCEVGNTNLYAVFRLILDTAVKHQVPPQEMPSKLVIISDMEFDMCGMRGTSSINFEAARRMYEAAGYRLPQLVYWNVQSRNRQQPVRMHENGTALVSGCTPHLFEMVAGELVDPYALMMEVLGGPRYAAVAA